MIGFSDEELMGAHLRKFISEEEFIKNTKRDRAQISSGGPNLVGTKARGCRTV
jgi:hypothetical protein